MADMSIEVASRSASLQEPVSSGAVIHPRWVRITHCINALAMFIMVGSGWQIYDASPLFDFLNIPSALALGDWLAGALFWHFAAMWLLVINGIIYVTLGFTTGRFRRKLLPIRFRAVFDDFLAALRGRLSHDLTVYNSVQRLLYAGVLAAGVVIVLSGLSIWKPVQFKYLTAFFGGYDTARYVHFFAMTAIVAFLMVHVALALIVPKSLRAIILGR
jgi:thiosulfate reductase cytochrome b subunit